MCRLIKQIFVFKIDLLYRESLKVEERINRMSVRLRVEVELGVEIKDKASVANVFKVISKLYLFNRNAG